MNPFKVFLKLVSRVGLFGDVTNDVLCDIGVLTNIPLPSPSMSSSRSNPMTVDEVALHAASLSYEDRTELVEALNILSLNRIVDPDRNRMMLEKLHIDTKVKYLTKWATGEKFPIGDKNEIEAITEELKSELPDNCQYEKTFIHGDDDDWHNVFRQKNQVHPSTYLTKEQINLLVQDNTQC